MIYRLDTVYNSDTLFSPLFRGKFKKKKSSLKFFFPSQKENIQADQSIRVTESFRGKKIYFCNVVDRLLDGIFSLLLCIE